MKRKKSPRIFAFAWMPVMALILGACTGDHGQVSDKDAIVRQLQNHHYYWDGRDMEAWSALFTEDAVTHSYKPGKTEPGWTSPDRETLMKASRSYLEKLEGIQTRHHPSGIQFLELTETTALTLHTALITHQKAGEPQPSVSMSATYKFHWIKAPGGWLIQQRDFYRD